jgi:hypothetical protein
VATEVSRGSHIGRPSPALAALGHPLPALRGEGDYRAAAFTLGYQNPSVAARAAMKRKKAAHSPSLP